MKITIIAGIEKICESNTYDLILQLVNQIKISEQVVEVSIYSGENIKLNHCLGCCNCFIKGNCILDATDNFSQVRTDLMNSDIVIFASPVYVHQISGTMKLFIDRIASWTHLLKLRGKLGVVISVSSTNGNEFVDFYLKKVLEYLGVIVVDNISVAVNSMKQDSITDKIRKSAEIVTYNYHNKENVRTSQKQEMFFQNMKQIYQLSEETYEKKYWIENGYMNSNSYEEIWSKST